MVKFRRSLSPERKIPFGYSGDETLLGAGLFTFSYSKTEHKVAQMLWIFKALLT